MPYTSNQMIRSGNPALKEATFENLIQADDPMTLSGVVNKTAILLTLCLLTASWCWNQFLVLRDPSALVPYMLIGGLGGFAVGLLTIFNKTWAPATSLIYALLEGLAVGSISAFYEFRFPGIVMQAVGLTFTTLIALLMAYKSGWIKPTENFKLGVAAATGAIAVLYLIDIILLFLGTRIPFIHESGPLGILFSLFAVTMASLNLVLDFDFIENGVQKRAPKYMEWYSAFGLLVTLVWLYMEILRLLSKIKKR